MTFDMSQITAEVIVADDRVAAGQRPDKAGPLARAGLEGAGTGAVDVRVAAESRAAQALADALARRIRLVLVLGGTGVRGGDRVPEAVREAIELDLPGIAEQIRAHGLETTPLSVLSRGVVGVTAGPRAAVVVASPGSRGGVRDTLDVLTPLLPHIFAQLDED